MIEPKVVIAIAVIAVLFWKVLEKWFLYGLMSNKVKDHLLFLACSRVFVEDPVESYELLLDRVKNEGIGSSEVLYLQQNFEVFEEYYNWTADQIIEEIESLYEDFINIYKHEFE